MNRCTFSHPVARLEKTCNGKPASCTYLLHVLHDCTFFQYLVTSKKDMGGIARQVPRACNRATRATALSGWAVSRCMSLPQRATNAQHTEVTSWR